MKKLLWILPLLLLFSCNNYRASRGPADWIYVSQTGNDGTGDGSSGAPYATVSFACTQATSGDTVYVMAGTINQGTTQIVKPVGVSIYGAGPTSHIISSYTNASSLQAAIQCASTAGTTTNDNSTISHIRLTGNDITSTRAIYVGYRNNVEIHHCTIEDFLDSGIYFHVSGTYSELYITGCSIHDCTINNSSNRDSGYSGAIRALGTDGLVICNNIIDMTERANGENGNSISTTRNKRLKIYDNTLYRNDHEITVGGVDKWNFFYECWDYKGDCEYYDNTHYGLGKLSLGGEYNDIEGGCTYGYKVYNNRFLNSANGNRTYSGETHTIYCINIEGDQHNGVDVYNNLIQRYAVGVELSTPSAGDGGYWDEKYWDWDDVKVHHNIIEKCGYADYRYSYGIQWLNETNTHPYYGVYENIVIANNTITGDNGGTYPGYHGIAVYVNDTLNNMAIQNNITYGFDQYGIYISEHSTDTLVIAGLDVTYNCMNDNGTNTVYVESGARITITDSDVATGNITTSPAFKSESTYRLTPASGCVDAGIDVGLDYDYYGHKITGTPDIGAHEYGNYLIKFNGKFLRDGNGKLKIIH